jgi:hypothetical protein
MRVVHTQALLSIGTVLALLLSGSASCAGSPRSSRAQDAASGGTAAGSERGDYDAALTDTARVLAGLQPEDTRRFARVLGRDAWRVHQREFNANWTSIEHRRFALMRKWRDEQFKEIAGGCTTLFYPFAGPDILNAYVLFPSCDTYLLFGLEPVGSVPAIERFPSDRADRALSELRTSLADIFVRDYFITKEMMSELRTPEIDGTVPLLMVFLARLDARIISLDRDGPWNEPPSATQATGAPASRVRGVTISFVRRGSTRVQRVSYIRVQMEDEQFKRKTALLAYLTRVAPWTTFVKSASYLMHDDRFSVVRSLALDHSTAVLQDDTGIPYRFFNPADWTLTLFGRYTPPIKDFTYGYQTDLDAAYRQPPGPRDLPFSFGYHWRQGSSSIMLAVRRAGVP